MDFSREENDEYPHFCSTFLNQKKSSELKSCQKPFCTKKKKWFRDNFAFGFKLCENGQIFTFVSFETLFEFDLISYQWSIDLWLMFLTFKSAIDNVLMFPFNKTKRTDRRKSSSINEFKSEEIQNSALLWCECIRWSFFTFSYSSHCDENK